MTDYIKELSKYIENKNLIKKCKIEATNFKIDVEYDCEFTPKYPTFILDFDYDEQKENLTWTTFVYDYKKEELLEFFENLKNDNFAYFLNVGNLEGLPYFDDCPHKMIAFPQDNKVRFIMVACEDYDNDEYIESDILVNKNIIVREFEKAIGLLEKLNKEHKA